MFCDYDIMLMFMLFDFMYNNSMNMNDMVMYMNFFWGKDVVVLFDGWLNGCFGMYMLVLVFVFLLAVAVEMLAAVFMKLSMSFLSGGLFYAVVYVVRMVFVYLIMLSVMFFNIGIFIVTVVGYIVGCFIVKYRAIAVVYMAVNNVFKV